MKIHGILESKMKKQCEEKNLGNSVYLCIYCHVQSLSVHILSICKSKAS
jgi:hypothetical protein